MSTSFKRGYLLGLEHAAEICRTYRDVWSDSFASDANAHVKAAHSLKMAINQQADKTLSEAKRPTPGAGGAR